MMGVVLQKGKTQAQRGHPHLGDGPGDLNAMALPNPYATGVYEGV